MSQLLEFLQTHEEAFRSRSRLASLYSDFRYQRQTNPDGYIANVSAWVKALSSAAEAGLLPTQSHASSSDHFVLHCGEELAKALQTQEHGRPLAIGAVVDEAVQKRDLMPLKGFLEAKESVYARKPWVPSPWEVGSWVLKMVGVLGGEDVEDRLVRGDFVIMRNLEAAAKAVVSQASNTATSNTSRIFSKELFSSSFAPTIGAGTISATDLSVLLTHLSRDRSAIAYDLKSGTVKFKSASESAPTAISEEDIDIASLRNLIISLEFRITELTNRISELGNTARLSVANKQVASAKSALRSKKLAESQLHQRSSTLAQLEEVYGKIEQAADQVEIVRVMEASSVTLRNLNRQTGSVEKVQDVMEDLRNEMLNTEEISSIINETSAGIVDEGEVEDELEAMEKVVREKREAIEMMERQASEEKEKLEKEERESEQAEVTRKRLDELDESMEKVYDLPSRSALATEQMKPAPEAG